eukprot:7159592-Alexandrium_andersonii.AAC.1
MLTALTFACPPLPQGCSTGQTPSERHNRNTHLHKIHHDPRKRAADSPRPGCRSSSRSSAQCPTSIG